METRGVADRLQQLGQFRVRPAHEWLLAQQHGPSWYAFGILRRNIWGNAQMDREVAHALTSYIVRLWLEAEAHV